MNGTEWSDDREFDCGPHYMPRVQKLTNSTSSTPWIAKSKRFNKSLRCNVALGPDFTTVLWTCGLHFLLDMRGLAYRSLCLNGLDWPFSAQLKLRGHYFLLERCVTATSRRVYLCLCCSRAGCFYLRLLLCVTPADQRNLIYFCAHYFHEFTKQMCKNKRTIGYSLLPCVGLFHGVCILI